MRRWTPLAKRNEERYRRNWLRQYGSVERVQKIQALACIVPGCRARSENCHLRTRRVATWREIFPACHQHHRQSHTMGLRLFAKTYGVDPWSVAERLALEVPA